MLDTMRIGDLAIRCGVPTQTIRYYEKRGDVENARVIFGRLAVLYENAEPAFQPIRREAVDALSRLTEKDS